MKKIATLGLSNSTKTLSTRARRTLLSRMVGSAPRPLLRIIPMPSQTR